MNLRKGSKGLVWDEDPHWQHAQFWFLAKLLTVGLPLPVIVCCYTGNLEALRHYLVGLAGFGLVFALWWLIAPSPAGGGKLFSRVAILGAKNRPREPR